MHYSQGLGVMHIQTGGMPKYTCLTCTHPQNHKVSWAGREPTHVVTYETGILFEDLSRYT